MRSQTRTGLLSVAMLGGLSAGGLWFASDGLAQTTADPDLRPTERGTIERRGIDEGAGPTMRSTTPRTDEAVAERERLERERLHDRYGDRDRHHRGETYVAGFGGWTFGGTTSSMDGRGSAFGQSVASPDLEDSIVYGMKIGYFHPGRLNWLGLEIEGYNSNPHLKQTGITPGTHMRLTTLGLNAIARTKLGCRDRGDHRGGRDHRAGDGHDYSPLDDNERCPVHLYAGAGLGVFFAETSNQLGRSTDNARAGFNGLAGLRYFFTKHVAMFAEYKFNYVDLKFDQNQLTGIGGLNGGPAEAAGLSGTYMIHHVVGGLSVHF
jgi:opacity protein-like surface antigen